MNDVNPARNPVRKLVLAAVVCISVLSVTRCDNFLFSDILEDPSAGGGGPLVISPVSATLLVNTKCVFAATGGTPPLVFSLQSGGGSVDAESGVYTAPGTPGSAVIRVRDNQGEISEAEAIYIE
jgi:hypothetical protein